MQTIYIDVLIVLNIYVNFFLLKATARLTNSPLKTSRCIGASVYGSLFSLFILVPDMCFLVNFLIKLFTAVTIVPFALGFHGIKRFLTDSFTFFAVNFIFAGGVYAVYSWFKPDFIHVSNSYVYVDFSMIVLMAVTAVLYFIICISGKIFGRNSGINRFCKVKIRYKSRIIECDGIADTGNELMDLFSGKRVVICSNDNFLTLTESEEMPKGFRILPCNTVNGGGVIRIFRPDEVVITDRISGEKKSVDVMVGSGECGDKIIFNPAIL